jgi:hypothetical protein
MSSKTAACAGSARSGANASGKRPADTHLVCPLVTEGLDERRALKLALTGTTARVGNDVLGLAEERWLAEVIAGAKRVPVA